ncbi:MAG: nitroreductase family protein [Peptococcaceae bacterium]|nr:nitroreductase family protein [Peptococcaceae bacterium]
MERLFTVDAKKCMKDAACVKVCPLNLIVMKDSESLPEPVEKAERQCINCGHCTAICTNDALSLRGKPPEQCPTVDHRQLPTEAQAKLFLTARRSVRVYEEEPVEQAKLAEIIDTARYAPSGINSQPVRWLVIMDPQEVKRLTGMVIEWMRLVIVEQPDIARNFNMKRMVEEWEQGIDRICRNAPHIIVAHAPESLGTSQSSCTIALTYLELAAFANGLGACWAGFFHTATMYYPPMAEALKLPDGHKCFGAMLIGYPQYQYHRLPLRKAASITWR